MCFCLRIHENRRFSFQWWTSFQSQKQNLHDNNLLLEAESSYNPPSHKPIGILPQPGTSNHETSHNPSIPQTEISWVVSWVSNIYIFFGFFSGHFDLWLPFHCSHHRVGGYHWYGSIWKQLRGEGVVESMSAACWLPASWPIKPMYFI